MTKMWIALVVTNAIWAGWAFAQSSDNGVGPPSTMSLPFVIGPVGHLAAGESPTHKATVIQTDEEGYVICSPERKP